MSIYTFATCVDLVTAALAADDHDAALSEIFVEYGRGLADSVLVDLSVGRLPADPVVRERATAVVEALRLGE